MTNTPVEKCSQCGTIAKIVRQERKNKTVTTVWQCVQCETPWVVDGITFPTLITWETTTPMNETPS